MDNTPLTLGEVARHFGLQRWQVQRLAEQDRFAYVRVGDRRVVYQADLPAVRQALVNAGYLMAQTEPQS